MTEFVRKGKTKLCKFGHASFFLRSKSVVYVNFNSPCCEVARFGLLRTTNVTSQSDQMFIVLTRCVYTLQHTLKTITSRSIIRRYARY